MQRIVPVIIFSIAWLIGCTGTALNNPYPKAEEGKNILYGSFSERPKHLDPARSYSSNEIVFTAQIYEPPFQYHYLKRPYTLIPLTATKMPVPIYLDAESRPLPPSANEQEIVFSLYEITIQPSIFYQPHPAFAKSKDGDYLYHALTDHTAESIHALSDFQETGTRELTAEDYLYGIKRLAHPKIDSPIYGFMSEYIVGLKEFSAHLKEMDETLTPGPFLDLSSIPLLGVHVIDRYTYQIKIRGKYPQFIYWLAMPFFAPIPWEADRFYSQPVLVDKNITLDWYPIGTGPYMLSVNDPNRKMVLIKNPNFHGERYPTEGEPEDRLLLANAGRSLPLIDAAVYTLEKENIPVWNKFLQGYYDAAGVGSDQFDQAIRIDPFGESHLTEEMEAKGVRLLTSVAPTTYYVGINMLDSVVGGNTDSARKLRQAISIAIDQEESIVIFNNGRGMPMQGPVPPGIFGYREGEAGTNRFTYTWVNGQRKRKSIQEAKQLLAEAGYPNGREEKTGKPLILYFDTAGAGPDDKAHFDWLRKQFAKIDIQLVVRATDYNRFQDKMLKGTAQIFQWGWHADYPDPENFLFLLYSKNAKVGNNGENATNYSNPEFDRLFDQMRNMENTAERAELIDQMVEIIRRDAPWIAGFHPENFGLYHAWYSNIKQNAIAYNTLKYAQLDGSMRATLRRQWNRPVRWPLILLGAAFAAFFVPAIVAYRKRERSL